MIVNNWLNQAIRRLSSSETPRCDAEIILETVTGKSRMYFSIFRAILLNREELLYAESLLIRRIYGEPIAYLVGTCEFWSLNLKILPNTFIPRPDTECLVEQVLSLKFKKHDYLDVLDLGTGNGAIALAIASERPSWHVTGIDYQLNSVALARENAVLLGLKNTTFLFSNWFKALQKKKYNLIISNPPYLDKCDPYLQYGSIRFEPRCALVSYNQGLSDLIYICFHAKYYLQLGGWLFLEHGWNQGRKVHQLFIQFGFNNVTTVRDYGNNERVTYGQL